MKTVLITGPSAAGKSSLAGYLREHGRHAVSLDGCPGLCDWVDEHGHAVPWPTAPDLAWLARHRWIWRPDALDAVIAEARATDAGVAFLCGRADNAEQLRDRFDAVIALRIGPATMQARLTGSPRGNPYGRMGDTLAFAVANLERDQRHLDSWADATVDADRPLPQVADDVLSTAALAVLRRS